MFKFLSSLSLNLRSRRLRSRLGHRSLGIAWLHGTFQAVTYLRQEPVTAWVSPTPVLTAEDFASALSTALTALKFTGVDTFLLLAHEQFTHQNEQAPPAAEAARIYLRTRVEKFEQENKIRVLSVHQRTASARQDWSFLIHLLPSDFHEKLITALRTPHLELTRIVPLSVPLQILLDRLCPEDQKPQVLAIDTGNATSLLIGPPREKPYISRTITVSMAVDAARIGTEINRSILFAKQQFAAQIDDIHLLGESADQALQEIQARSGPGKTCHAHLITGGHLLDATATLPIKHPVNLVADHLSRIRRNKFIRQLALAASWALLLASASQTFQYLEKSSRETQHLTALSAQQETMEQERAALSAQLTENELQKQLGAQTAATTLPPVPEKAFPYFTSQIPDEIRLSEATIRRDSENSAWLLHFDGQIEADPETASDILTSLQRQLTRSPLSTHFVEQARALVASPSPQHDARPVQRFSLQAALFQPAPNP